MVQSDDMRKLMDLLNAKEDLHPDLVPHLTQGRLGTMIHHPLVISVMHTPQQNAHVNYAYELKKAEVEKSAQEGNWRRYVYMHERPYRLEALMNAADKGLKVDPKEYWSLVGSVWTDSENIWQEKLQWQKIWTEAIPHREFCMDKEDRAALSKMPGEFQVWRGTGHHSAARGLSWTINHEKAIWFAKRFSGHGGRIPHLVGGIAQKKHVLAYFGGRGESEIVILPRNVKNQTTEVL